MSVVCRLKINYKRVVHFAFFWTTPDLIAN
jgi:hypothetical protein